MKKRPTSGWPCKKELNRSILLWGPAGAGSIVSASNWPRRAGLWTLMAQKTCEVLEPRPACRCLASSSPCLRHVCRILVQARRLCKAWHQRQQTNQGASTWLKLGLGGLFDLLHAGAKQTHLRQADLRQAPQLHSRREGFCLLPPERLPTETRFRGWSKVLGIPSH